MFALYYMDILSDVAQTFTLFNNCHGDYGAISFAIIASSYLFSSIYIKLVDNLKWFQSFMHPYTTGWVKWHMNWITVQGINFHIIILCSGHMRRYIVNCWNALMKGQEMPSLPQNEDRSLKRVSFLEATTEALPQFTLSNVILRIFGVSDNLSTKILQYFSLSTSMLSLFLAFIMVRKSLF